MAEAAAAAALPIDGYPLPAAFRIGTPRTVESNEILSGLYGAMVDQILEIRRRPDIEANVNDLRSYRQETKGKVKDLRTMHIKAIRRADRIIINGGNAFVLPAALNYAAEELYQQFDLPALGAAHGGEVEAGGAGAAQGPMAEAAGGL